MHANGDVVEGAFVHGVLHGCGEERLANADVRRGGYFYAEMEGRCDSGASVFCVTHDF